MTGGRSYFDTFDKLSAAQLSTPLGDRGDRDLEPPISIILILSILPILLRNFGTRIHTKKLEPRMMRIIANEE
jgi:hypothetical protein